MIELAALLVEAWTQEVSFFDAKEVRAHLLEWNVWSEDPRREVFESLVEILFHAGVDGPGLLYLRDARVYAREGAPSYDGVIRRLRRALRD